ncbi:hypothetical protein PoMZ_02895 [Pyricularia oryzae]|uniref:Pwl3 protein n=2 Tax=Pyricularia TaxID=48558 RepID=Q01150_PYRGI|nr:Pwl3 protein [Pyricularia grisea]QBZ57957.1 hypothetical protein PoMZ_02895 [Pyricularia oryzae]prf//2210377B PWL3 gene [Pyricularia grisea]
MKINTSILALTLALLPGMATAGRKWLNKKLWDANGQSAGSVSIVKGGQGSINTDTGPITAEGSYDIYERNGKIEGGPPGYKYTEDRYEDRKDDRYYNTHGYHVGDGPAEYGNYGGGHWGDGYYGPPGEFVKTSEYDD